MKKYIKSTRSNLVYEIERQDFSETFRTPDNYFQHATRAAWFSVNAGFNVFVYYMGAFYSVDDAGVHGRITTLEFVEITAEEAARVMMDKAAEVRAEAQREMSATEDAAIDYSIEDAKKHAINAEFAAKTSEIYARNAAKYAAEAHTSEASSAADIASEYADSARSFANRAAETAEQAAAEAERIEHDAAAYQWSAEETAREIEYRKEIKTANSAALSLLDAYADVTGEHPHEDDDETRAAYRVARDEITGTACRATEHDRTIVADMVEDIAARATFEARRLSAEDIRAKFDSPWLEWEEDATLKTYPDIAAAHAAGASELVAVITHEDARRAYDLAAEAEEAIPAAHVRKRVDARTKAIDAAISAAARYADAKDAAKHIAGQRVEYLHRHSVNLGTSRYPDHRAEYEQYWKDSLILHATASKTGKSIERIPLVFVVLVID